MNPLILKLKDISFAHRPNDLILKEISLDIHQNDRLGILGPNGSGKSTLMNIIAGLLTPNSGEVIRLKNNLKISYISQSFNLNTIFPITVKEFLKVSCTKAWDEDIFSALETTGVEHKQNSLLSELSGGEKQRALIARSILEKPDLLLLDEPTKGLDGQGVDQLLKVLKDLQEKFSTSIIIIDHNINEVVRFCDKILCMNKNIHWHNRSELLTKNILEDIYHCEFEHLKIHEDHHSHGQDHVFCQHDTHHDHHDNHPEKKVAHRFIIKGRR